ncbi:MAG: hypothetical protein AAF772_01040 [Acidobacteriota bacterium]
MTNPDTTSPGAAEHLPDWEDLAAYVDGRLDDARRRSVEARLADDSDYYETFIATSDFVLAEDTARDEVAAAPARRLQTAWLPWLAAAAVVLVCVGLLAGVWPATQPNDDPAAVLNAQAIAKASALDVPPAWSITLAGSSRNDRAVEQDWPADLAASELTFRIGARTTNWQVAHAAGDDFRAQKLAKQLDAMASSDPSGFTYGAVRARDQDALRDAARRFAISLGDSTKPEVQRYQQGRWLQALRLTLLTGDAEATEKLRDAMPDLVTALDEWSEIDAALAAGDREAARAALQTLMRALGGDG